MPAVGGFSCFASFACLAWRLQRPPSARAAFADDYMILPLIDGGQVLVAWVDNSTTAVLAWRAADNATEAMTSSSVQMAATSFLGNDFANATVNNATLDPFEQALQGTANSSQDLATVCCTHQALVPPDCECDGSDQSPHEIKFSASLCVAACFVCCSGPSLLLLVQPHAAQRRTTCSATTPRILPWTACLTSSAHCESPHVLLLQNLFSI